MDGGCIPGKVGILGSGSAELEGAAIGVGSGFAHADIGGSHALSQFIGGGEGAFIAEELHDFALGIDQRQTIGARHPAFRFARTTWFHSRSVDWG